MVEVREVIRLWLAGRGPRAIARQLAIDRKTVRRYMEAARAAGLQPGQAEPQRTDAVVEAVISDLRPGRRQGTMHGDPWRQLVEHKAFVEARLKEGLTLTKIESLLRRQGLRVPYRTLDRFAVSELGFTGRQQVRTVRVADGEPGKECQLDFGRMGWLLDPSSGQRRQVYGLIFTPVVSRYHFCWLCYRQTLADVIEGCEAAWQFFGGVFEVLIPDSLKAIVNHADPIAPRFNPVFWNYAQSRQFFLDPARVRRPTDKPRVERVVPYCRSWFRGEQFGERTRAQTWMTDWCRNDAGMRIHGTTQRRPREHFELEEQPRLGPPPTASYVIPLFAEPKVHRDYHIEVARALYSVPGNRIGQRVQVWVVGDLVKIYAHGLLIREHPRQAPGGRSTNPDDLPKEKRGYAMRDIKSLQQQAAGRGAAVGRYATRLLDSPLPWTRMRQVYRLLRLADRYGQERVEAACARALLADVVDVTRINRMLEQGLERDETNSTSLPAVPPPPRLRFARPTEDFVPSPDGGLAEVSHA